MSKTIEEEVSSLKCMDGKVHIGDYMIELQRAPTGIDEAEESVVYWCTECGAAAIDHEVDRRRCGKLMKLTPSELFNKGYNK
ncbi:hypothetical protein HN903_03350 [archaeon]|jgi:hypothetical protein|nr:hypothetical protein [archaeon]MBT7128766.1 hypothetical protein [archaeon]